ncbi:hypothetical protein MIND_00807800 [Mycena indigotica]|uniref:Uncharacterized protein n=1 Tax=Mycena indigotica TaxID=2126181 RepID=A0A8H6VYL9_9AGAR|nr:uncharacterized protein MIND_00807800 [Mycena indigotica]KAF7298607.1 hypothetical protein MIND_00807800 [Mycena indigotica]
MKLLKEDIRCLEDSADLEKKRLKAERMARQKARDDRELRAAGIVPLIVRREEKDDEDDERANEDSDDDVFGSSAMTGASTRRRGDIFPAGESRRDISWIWKSSGSSDETTISQEREEALRIEWAKAWARMRHWSEEVRILQEEWRRVIVSMNFEAEEWLKRASFVPTTSADGEGISAYAHKQADMYRKLALRAEVVRTQPKLRKGVRRPSADVELPEDEGDGVIELDHDENELGNGSDDDEEEDDNEQEDINN